MNTWYTVKVKYTKQLEDGRLKNVTEPYLIDAVSFTDAEARAYEEVGSSVRGEFSIKGITKTDFADIFYYEDCDDWYKCKLSYVNIDADSGKEKKISNNYLVTASNVQQAYERIHESMQDMMVTFDIPSIMLTPIVEVLPYNPDLDVELDRRPLENNEEIESQEEIESEIHDDSVEESQEDAIEETTESQFEDETER